MRTITTLVSLLAGILTQVPLGAQSRATGTAAAPATAVPAVRIETGEIAGAKFTVARPAGWNGRVLLVAPGQRPADAPLSAALDVQQYRHRALLERGWLIAKTSYRRNGIVVADAIADLDALRAHVARTHGPPLHVVLEGEDLGGLIVTLMAERDPRVQPNGRPEVSGAIAIDPSLDLREERMSLGLSLQPQMPLLFLVNQGQLDGPRRYATSPAMNAGASVAPLLFVIARDGHLHVGERERVVAIEALETWLSVGRDALPRPMPGNFHDATLPREVAQGRATAQADARGFAARAVQVTPASGTIELAASIADFEAAGVLPMSWFQLKVGDRTYRTRYGRDIRSVERGEWVAYPNTDGSTWIARNGGNAAASAGVKAGDAITIQRY